MTVIVVVQARMGSTRLPGKVLRELAGQPMLGFQLDRLARLECDRVVVATSDQPGDDAVVDLAVTKAVDVVRGSESDVLGRFGVVLEEFPADHVVRLTGDCPLSDPELVREVIALHMRSGAAYTSNVHPRSYPRGLDVEVATRAALAEAVAEAVTPYDREHVTPYLYDRARSHPQANLAQAEDLSGLRWTVDTEDDLDHVCQLVSMVADPMAAGWRSYLDAERRAGAVS